ncbi:MAG: hypothetical protein AAF431_12480 [Pseudomonadota bacterium]
MFHMLSCFDLRPGVSLAECQKSFLQYGEYMVDLGLVDSSDPIGQRDTDTILDTDEGRTQQYFQLMHFTDKDQSERAVAYIKSMQEPGKSIHQQLYAKLENMVFVCWADI